jgi:hypothetical protein
MLPKVVTERSHLSADGYIRSVSNTTASFGPQTVGEHLRGRKSVKVKNKETVQWQIDDPALILAIFPEVPYCVVTYSNGKSHFGELFYATPRGIELFSS